MAYFAVANGPQLMEVHGGLPQEVSEGRDHPDPLSFPVVLSLVEGAWQLFFVLLRGF